ncbi:ABC transporter permease [Devosia chinhatensis]|uniref:ABC transporter permease n=1 Tax=Devosia chinhatensis TaxID=429727 RepID=A0A0F5FK94_9HYPH|nr:ABC transporter permease [Devosia chinhatensis]KKB08622.1 ABC transporter permease [Devosia chinhatensis]
MTLADTAHEAEKGGLRIDPLGIVVAVVALFGLATPFAVYKANRIVPGDGLWLWQVLPPAETVLGVAVILGAIGFAVIRIDARWKLAVSSLGLAAMALLIGRAADGLMTPDNSYARTAFGTGFWLITFSLALMLTDALSRLRLRALGRIGLLIVAVLLLYALLASGVWNNLSILKEYDSRAPAFWQEARIHLLLAFGSVAIAVIIGVPVGVLCYKIEALRASVLNGLNVIQTIPSIALFGMLIAPLGWLAANVPGASAAGISGIGVAPAMVALVAYALLPIVANTLVGLTGLPQASVEAARGMGMTWRQRLFSVELPLAFPVMLTGVRIVLVQNIGLATIAALIGGGGFGVFVFQGIGQTAIDLVLLGAVPTVVMAFAAAVLLDSLIEVVSGRRQA